MDANHIDGALTGGAPRPSGMRRSITSVGAGMATSEGAGVKLTRIIGQPALPDLDPFLMLDAFNSDDPDAYIAGFPDHPHRGFETVTYMLAGALRHRDNQGNVGLLGPGALQWMTAGRGIVHSEMPEQRDGLMRGFQLWLNLPARDKMGASHYRDVAAEALPSVCLAKGVQAKILAGEAAVQLRRGDLGARLLFAAAKPLREPIAKYGPFVMTTEAEIHQAIADFRSGSF